MNKEKHSLHNFAALQSRGATQRNSSLPQTWLLIQKEWILKMTFTQINGSKIKTPSSKSLILVSFCWKKNVLLITALTNLIKSLISLELVIESVAFFLGHPVLFWKGLYKKSRIMQFHIISISNSFNIEFEWRHKQNIMLQNDNDVEKCVCSCGIFRSIKLQAGIFHELHWATKRSRIVPISVNDVRDICMMLAC